MITLESLRRLRNRGTLDELYAAGFLSHRAYLALEIASNVERLKKQGMTNGQAVVSTATLLGYSRKTIYKALECFG